MTSFLKKVARLVKLQGAANLDLEMALYRDAGSFEGALALWVERFIADLETLTRQFGSIPIAGDVVDLNSRKILRQWSEPAERFAARADFVLAHRCRQFSDIAALYHVRLPADKRAQRTQKALAYLAKMDQVLGTLNRLAERFLAATPFGADTDLTQYLTVLRDLTWTTLQAMLARGEVPFRYKT